VNALAGENGGVHRYRPQLDGLRALAVAAVAWSHWERPYQFGVPFGAGVHLFYVLSGFLITAILLEMRSHSSRAVALRAFYIRRALRIFPAFYLTLGVAWWANVTPVRETFVWHATYLSNVRIFLDGQWPGSISHWWSLAVEEQFYLVWPWLILFVPRRWLLATIVAAISVAPSFRWWLADTGYRETMLAVLTPGCLDSLGIGSLLALLEGARARPAAGSSEPLADARGREHGRSAVPFMNDDAGRLGKAIVAAAVAFWMAMLVLESASPPVWVLATKQTLQAIVFAGIVHAASRGIRGWFGALLSAAPIVYLGRISYGIYLVHGFTGDILGGLGIASRSIPEPLRFFVLCALTVGLASLSWHLIEAPINRLKRHFPYAASAVRGGEEADAGLKSRDPALMKSGAPSVSVAAVRCGSPRP
jgi:peptidoglycan/LPS O-acetylase OafA/YrhL